MPSDRSSRLLAAAERIRATVPEVPDEARTSADPDTGEQWDRGQVLAHVAEILPYWSEQAELVVERGGGVPFGRVKSNPERIAAIERDRRTDTAELLKRMDQGLQQVLALLERLDERVLGRIGTHERLGEMTVGEIIDRFLVEHLEEHAEQLQKQLRKQPQKQPRKLPQI
jgi:DinB superfamily